MPAAQTPLGPIMTTDPNQLQAIFAQAATAALTRRDELRARLGGLRAKHRARPAPQADTQAAAANAWMEKCNATKAEPGYEDMDVLLTDDVAKSLQFSPIMQQALGLHDMGPKILYYFRKNPEECKRVFEATNLEGKPTPEDIQRAILTVGEEFGAIKATLRKPSKPAAVPAPVAEPEVPVAPAPVPEKPKPQVSKAPIPIRPVGTKAVTPQVDTSGMSASEYFKYTESLKRR